MLDLRPTLNEAMHNIQRWRNVYSSQVYPHKIVLNIMYRAYSTRVVYEAFLSDELPEFDNFFEAAKFIQDFYGSAAIKEVVPNLERWMKINPNENVGTVCTARYERLATMAETDNDKKEELEFSYVFELINDFCVLYYIAFRLTGQSQVDAIKSISNFVIEEIPNMDYTLAKQALQQLIVARFMHENYNPLPE